MSKVSITGNNAGSGTFTIAAPDSNNNRQIDLPDLAGTVLTDTTDLEPQVKTSLNATGSAPVYACRAWVNFSGTGTVSILGSGNVSSVTDVSTGKYTINMSTAMPDNNYCVTVSGAEANGDSQARNNDPSARDYETSSFFMVNFADHDNSFNDLFIVNAAVFR